MRVTNINNGISCQQNKNNATFKGAVMFNYKAVAIAKNIIHGPVTEKNMAELTTAFKTNKGLDELVYAIHMEDEADFIKVAAFKNDEEGLNAENALIAKLQTLKQTYIHFANPTEKDFFDIEKDAAVWRKDSLEFAWDWFWRMYKSALGFCYHS